MRVFRAHVLPVRRRCAYRSLKVGDCVTLSSRLSSEPPVCHVRLPSVRAEKEEEELLLVLLLRFRTQKRVKRCRESGNDRAGASYRRGVTPAPAHVWSSASVPSIQTGRHAAEARVPSSFLEFVSQTRREAETTWEHRHGSLREKRVATQKKKKKSCPERLIKASCRPFLQTCVCFPPGIQVLPSI